jgi:hypothetical protein
MLKKLLNVLTSLRLTVVCLCMGIVLVFVGTLAQADEGLYQAQARYFKHWIVVGTTLFGHKIPLILPGGYLVGTVLLINLVAAHIKRFVWSKKKIGIFMVHAGLILLLLGQLLTDVLSVESAMRLGEGESKNYSQDFGKNELAVIDVTDPQRDEVVSIPESMMANKKEIRHASLPFTLKVNDYWVNADVDDVPPGEAKSIDANAGRYTNSMALALPPPADASGRSRAAVLVEILSTNTSVGTYFITANERMGEEQKLTVGNRKWTMSMLFAPNFGGNNLVFSDPAAGREGMVMISENELTPNAEIRRDGLPLTLRIKQFWPNCRIYHKPAPNSVRPKPTQGVLTDVILTPMPPVIQQDARNLPATLVEVSTSKGTLGSWLLSCELRAKQEFTYENRTYQLALRFKRHYKPYSIRLLDVKHEVYRGTEIPRNFSSRVRIQRPDTGEDREVLIYMNNPLRYEGETFYQYQVGPDEMDRSLETSTLQVIRNPGWLTPYFSCALMSLGLVVQFLTHLIGFAMKWRVG